MLDRLSESPSKRPPAWAAGILLLICALAAISPPVLLHAAGQVQVLGMIGDRDALILAGPDNRILLQKNARTPLIPASTLKLLSALAVMDTLGLTHRFETHFYAGTDGAIRIKGFGDPLLISEIVAEMATQVFEAAHQNGRAINSLRVDDSYFATPIDIPGVMPSSEPYDAPLGAFCVNFNTVNYRVEGNAVFSAEAQTPLLPFAENLIRQKGIHGGGRIVLSHDNHAIALYGAHLLAYFLAENGAVGIEQVTLASANTPPGSRLLVYRSPFGLTDLVKKMMAFSNNFVANQLVIAAGAKKYGPPGTLAKGLRLLESYCREKLALEAFTLGEGSGISRQNRFTALALLKIVTEFEPYHDLLRYRDGEYYKTGTLKGVRSRVGYIQRPGGGFYRFVIVVNTPGRSAAGIKRALNGYLIENDYP